MKSHALLQPLCGEWLSARCGPLRVQPASICRLEVWQNQRPRFVGHISLEPVEGQEKPRVFLRPKSGAEFRLWPDSPKGALQWLSLSAAPEDFWDARCFPLLQQVYTDLAEIRPDLQLQLQDAWDAMQGLREFQPLPFSVGLCTSTMNRLWQLQHALPITLMHCYPYRERVRVYVVDLGSSDGTLKWILRHCRFFMEIDLLRVFRAEEPYWHASVGKNAAHAQAEEQILVNVDGDNMIGAGFLRNVCDKFAAGDCAVAQYELGQGTCGRIALRRDTFWELGGYDEDAYPMGCQDTDLVLRVKMLNRGRHVKVRDPTFSQAISNTQEQKIENCDPQLGFKKWGQMNEKNRQKFLQRRSNGEIRRNQAAGTMGVALVWHRYVDGECRQKSLDIARLKVDPVPKPPVEAPQEPELIIEEC